jgi:hypothetical protein
MNYAPLFKTVHNEGMRTRANINLDADAYNFAAAYASAKGIPLGAAVSELLRRAEQLPEPPISTSPRLKTSPRGYLVKAKTGRLVTPEIVKEASEDELL